MRIEPLTTEHVPHALVLSTQAGWNQLEADWLRLIRLWPDRCLGGWVDGKLVATATLATYRQRVAWVGMVIVDQAMRGRGLGGKMFRAITDLQRQFNVTQLGLDATDLGRPVYLKHNFTDLGVMTRWIGSVKPDNASQDESIHRIGDGDWPALASMDQQATGVDRLALLRMLAAERGASCLVMREGQALRGYGFARPGRMAGHVGPIVAARPEHALRLLSALTAGAADKQVLIDVPGPAGRTLGEALPHRGFTVQRVLTRMVRPALDPPVLEGSQVFAAGGLELG